MACWAARARVYGMLGSQGVCPAGQPGFMSNWSARARVYGMLVSQGVWPAGQPGFMPWWAARVYALLVSQARVYAMLVTQPSSVVRGEGEHAASSASPAARVARLIVWEACMHGRGRGGAQINFVTYALLMVHPC